MAWEKAPQGLVDHFDESLPGDPRIERRRMFGYPVAFVQGNMAAGLFQSQAFVRPSPDLRATLEAEGAKPFEPAPGRPMRDYLTLPDEILADEERFRQALAEAIAFTAGLPPKPKPPRRPRAKA